MHDPAGLVVTLAGFLAGRRAKNLSIPARNFSAYEPNTSQSDRTYHPQRPKCSGFATGPDKSAADDGHIQQFNKRASQFPFGHLRFPLVTQTVLQNGGDKK
ncbi:MAG: hypothetical protein CML02_15475 [Pseudooceanicola sp.]|nr:hypothetical protein [Pseudooceanicola sp.]